MPNIITMGLGLEEGVVQKSYFTIGDITISKTELNLEVIAEIDLTWRCTD